MKKYIKNILGVIVVLLLLLIIYFDFVRKPKTKLSYRYAIPSVKYENYNTLLNEIKEIKSINKAYIEKEIGNIQEWFTIRVAAVDDFNAITYSEKKLVDGRFPTTENEVMIHSGVLEIDNIKNIITTKDILNVNIGSFLTDEKYTNLLILDETCLNNIQEKNYKIVGTFKESSPSGIYTKLNPSTLTNNDKINIILDIEEEIDKSILENLFTKYTTLENVTTAMVSDYGYVYAIEK